MKLKATTCCAALLSLTLLPSAVLAATSASATAPTMQGGQGQQTEAGVDHAAAEPLPEIGVDQLAVFKLHRGFYFASDIGVSTTLTGVNGAGNVQPFLTLKGGYDINEWLSAQAYLSMAFSSVNPLSSNDQVDAGGAEVADYSMFNFGAGGVAAWRPLERMALEFHTGFGGTRIYPLITDPNNRGQILGAMAPHLATGIDVKYLTLLTDFTVGLSVNTYVVLKPVIVALASGVSLRYTF